MRNESRLVANYTIDLIEDQSAEVTVGFLLSSGAANWAKNLFSAESTFFCHWNEVEHLMSAILNILPVNIQIQYFLRKNSEEDIHLATMQRSPLSTISRVPFLPLALGRCKWPTNCKWPKNYGMAKSRQCLMRTPNHSPVQPTNPKMSVLWCALEYCCWYL